MSKIPLKWSDSVGFAREAAKVESMGEAIMLAMMWNERKGWSCVTQYPIAAPHSDIPYRIDIAVPEARIAVEVNSFGAHGSADAMAHDARRRTVLSLQGWDTVELPAQDVFLRGWVMLIERVLPMITMRLGSMLPMRPSVAPKPPMGQGSAAVYGRALLATLAEEPCEEPLRLSASQRALAGRSASEHIGIELLGAVLDFPQLILDPVIATTLSAIDGPVALAAAAVKECMTGEGLDYERYLQRCPALLHPFSVVQFALRSSVDVTDARAQAMSIVSRLGGM